MALSGNFNTGSVTGFGVTIYFTFRWTATQNIRANTSTISWSLTSYTDPSGYSRGVRKVQIEADGARVFTQEWSYNSMKSCTYGTVVSSGSFTVSHNEEGQKTVGIVARVNVGNSNANSFNAIGSGSYVLDTIPRASEITCASPVAMNSSQTVTVTQKSTSFSHILQVRTSSSGSYTEIGRGTATKNYTWTVPDTSTAVTTTDRTTYTLRVLTYLNASYEGTPLETTLDIVATIPDSYVPTIAITSITEGNSNVPSGYPLLAGISKLRITTTFTGSHGSTCVSRSVSVPNNDPITSTSSARAVTMNFPNSPTNTTAAITANATDSRGRTASTTQTVNLQAYSTPQVQVSFSRCLQDGTLDPMGTYVLVLVKWQATAIMVSNRNRNTVTINGYFNGSTTPATITSTTASQTAWQQLGIFGPLAITNQGTLKVTVTDTITTTPSELNFTISKAALPFSLYDYNGQIGVTVGRLATEDGFRIYLDTHLFAGQKIIIHKADNTTEEHDVTELFT